MTYQDFDPEQAKQALDANPDLRLLDVRTEPEFAAYRIENATLIPVQEIAQRFDELDASASYLVYCEHGMRSVAACEFLNEQGFTKLTNLRGGMAAWLGAGLPHV